MRHRFLQLLVSAVVVNRPFRDLRQNRSTRHPVIHKCIISALIIISQKLMKEVGPALLADDWSVSLITQPSLQRQAPYRSIRSRTAAHGAGVTGNGNTNLLILRRRHLKEVFLPLQPRFHLSSLNRLGFAFIWELNVKLAFHFTEITTRIPWFCTLNETIKLTGFCVIGLNIFKFVFLSELIRHITLELI